MKSVKKVIRLFDEYSALNSLKDELMNQSNHAREEEIAVTTIDKYCSEHGIPKIDLLKIDTEGYELNVMMEVPTTRLILSSNFRERTSVLSCW
jgi:FkbM family methyltransferase